MDQQENHMAKPGNPHLLQAFRKELVRDSYNHTSNPGWNFKWTIPGTESRQDSTPNLDPFKIILPELPLDENGPVETLLNEKRALK